ncbi:MAG: ribonuclease P protein component [Alphaproteobacteria bacterium]|nr:ribonuclease P protein component [Alphaproteobacteria bacterium]
MKIITLTQKADFLRMKEHGKKYHLPCSTIIYTKNNNVETTRIAFALSRKFGNAVVRNKIRRQIRESIRKILKDSEPLFYDILFIPKKSEVEITFADLSMQIQKFFVFLKSNNQ